MTAPQITPRLEIDLARIWHNSAQLSGRLALRKVAVTGVTKVALGDPRIARAMLQGGVSSLGDSRIENIIKMRQAGIQAEFMLLRSPQLSRIDEVVQYADISLNSEPEVIRRLSAAAQRLGRRHRVLLMLELGDLREGIPLSEIEQVVSLCRSLPNIDLEGIGTNLTCLSGVKPDATNMHRLSDTAVRLRQRFGLPLLQVSGGNSSSLDWLLNSDDIGAVNNLRLGEAILLGRETLYGQPLPALYQDAISLVAEVIEARVKPSVPEGELTQNAFGERPSFVQRGEFQRSILAMGLQDIQLAGIVPQQPDLAVIGASSDHLVLDSGRHPLQVGDEVRFNLNYAATLAAMTSPFVEKTYLNEGSAERSPSGVRSPSATPRQPADS